MYGSQKTKKIEDIYISLDIASVENAAEGKFVNFNKVLEKKCNVVFLGRPGSGKSTMLKYLALQYINHKKISNKSHTKSQELNFPILIEIKSIVDIEQWREKTLLEIMKKHLDNYFTEHGDIPKKVLEKKLTAGECVVMLDGFDELTSFKERKIFANKINSCISKYGEKNNKFIMTCRSGFRTDIVHSAGFDSVFCIQKFTPEKIKQFIEKWYDDPVSKSHFNQGQKENNHIMNSNLKAKALERDIFNSDNLRELAQYPIMLTLIAFVHSTRGVKPSDERHLIYQECIKIFIERLDSDKLTTFPILKELNYSEKISILQNIAFFMQNNRLMGITVNSLIENVLKKICHNVCRNEMSSQDLLDFLNLIQERTGLVEKCGFDKKEGTKIAFSHDTFRQFLAAEEIYSRLRDEKKVFDYLMQKIEDDLDWWQEVGLLCLCNFKDIEIYQNILEEKTLNK